MTTLRRMISSIDNYTLWAFNPQPRLVSRPVSDSPNDIAR